MLFLRVFAANNIVITIRIYVVCIRIRVMLIRTLKRVSASIQITFYAFTERRKIKTHFMLSGDEKYKIRVGTQATI